MSSRITEDGAARKLQSFFKNVTDDFASKRKIFENEGRDLGRPADNSWFHNYTSVLKKYGLATPVKGSENGVVVTKGLSLTDKGRAVIFKDQGLQEPPQLVPQPIASPTTPAIAHREVQETTPAGVLAGILSEIESYNAGPSPWEIVINDVHIRKKGAPME
ncbi:hypothetical protein [Nocardia anaemiae]|uniref:hypothetical protein n=1 Tax=Nocardia anaemiae TaxID=263910 RepID=UPI000AABC8CC|nr:hypothetical protein [Nocardia anaemiae]